MELSETGTASEQSDDINEEAAINLALLDPPSFGWSATGGIVNVLPPQERARRRSTRDAFLKLKRGRERRKERLEAAQKKTQAPPLGGAPDPRFMMPPTIPAGPKPPPSTGGPRLKDPPTHFVNGNTVQQRKIPAVAAPGTTQHAPVSASTTTQSLASTGAAPNGAQANVPQQNIPNGLQAATQGMAAAAVAGLASFMAMNTGASITTPQQQTNTTTAVSNAQSQPRGLSEPFLQTATAGQSGSTSEAMSVDNAVSVNINTGNAQATAAAAASNGPSAAAAPATSNTTEPAATTTAPINNSNPPAESTQSANTAAALDKNVLRFRALDEHGVLDIYTYHRGREGMEPRDEETGYLACDVEPTDTNHGWEPPSMKLSIQISFPLGDDYTQDPLVANDNAASTSTRQTRRRQRQVQEKNTSGVQFTETIEWDLADPKTKTPLIFATGVAEEFGLSADQTLALAESIQAQINYYCQNKISYKAPLTLVDANGLERSNAASAHSPDMRGPPQLYASAVGETKPGMPIPQKLLQTTTRTVRSLGSSRGEAVDESAPDSTIEPMYREEVLRRAYEASSKKIAEKWPNGVVGMMETEENGTCHVCRKRRQTWHLACGNKYHALCSKHLAEMVGISIEDGDEPILVDSCPICDFRCSCRNCSRRLSSSAANLKSKYVDEGLTPDQVAFEDLFQSRLVPIASSKKEKKRSSSPKIDWSRTVRTTVPKVPAIDFPREVCAGRDVDPGTKDDYRTVFTAEGAFLQSDAPSYSLNAKTPHDVPEAAGVLEDGNVDYCHTCMKAGNLLCCDFCPRAFHPECIPVDEPSGGDGPWECMVCREEKETTDKDLVTGKASLDRVCATFVPFDHSNGIDTCVHVLSLIQETISKLIEYDFGFMFKEPVDCEAIPTYKTIKNPMDLGTISKRILNGDYLEKFKENESWDDVLVAVLQDIELVWHNCFIFNFDGSSVYRMAEVQRRKYLNIRNRSFDHLLSPETKRRVDEYVSANDQRRRDFRANTTYDRRASGRNKITVKISSRRSNRTVAVLDPDTGMIVKMYSSFKGANLAIEFLRGLGHEIEISSLSDWMLRKMVQCSAGDPSLLLFGYRWLYLEDLLKGKAKFGPSGGAPQSQANDASPPCTVEFKVEEESFVFLSIEEAVSWPNMPIGMSLTEVRQKLLEIPFDEWTTIGELPCRKIKQVSQESAVNGPSMNGDSSRLKQTLLVDVSKYSFPANVAFVKEDLITRRALAGFESASAAHGDWLATRQTSLVCPVDEPTDLEYFKKYYLDGERNVDGIIWRTTKASSPNNGSESASNAVGENVSNSTKHEAEKEVSDRATPDMGLENVSQGVDKGSGTTPTNGVRTSTATLPPTLQGYSLPPNLLNATFSPLRNSNGNFVGAKRKHDLDTLVVGRASKKAVVSTAS